MWKEQKTATPTSPYSEKSVRSFVVRSGKFTKGQQNSYQQLGPTYCLDYQNLRAEGGTVAMKSFWQPYLKGQRHFLCEIGFGTGSATWQIARDNPDVFYLGIEVYRSGIATLMQKAEEYDLEQIRIVEHDALEVLENMLPSGRLDGLHIFFPDPWPKKRHHKRRFMRAESLQLFHRCLRPNGYFYFVTDWREYAEMVREILLQQRALWDFGTSEQAFMQRTGFSEAQTWRPQTKFEAKAICEGRASFEIFLRKRDGNIKIGSPISTQ